MFFTLALTLSACSEYGLDQHPNEYDLAEESPAASTDGLQPGDIPGMDITTSDDPGDIPGMDVTTDDPGRIPGIDITTDDTPDEIPGIDIGHGDRDDLDYDEPDDEYADDSCEGGFFAAFDPGEISVYSWNNPVQYGEIEVPVDGVYEVWNTSIAESGDSQRNESAYVLVPNALNPSGEPLFPNCDGVRVLTDPDNDGALPAGTTRYIGTFPLEAGVNVLELHHYCPMYRDTGACPQFHDTVDADKTCDSDNINSVHFYPEQLCLYPL